MPTARAAGRGWVTADLCNIQVRPSEPLMTLEEHYSENGTLTAEQIEYLLAVHKVVRQIGPLLDINVVYEMRPPWESPLNKALGDSRTGLERLYDGLATMPDTLASQFATDIVTARSNLADIARLIDEFRRQSEAAWQGFWDALPPAMD